jgi:integrase
MTGSLQTKKGKYYILLNLHENGKRKQKWIPTGLDAKGNKRKAEQLLREKLQEQERPEEAIMPDLRFSDAVREWLREVELRVDVVTWQGYNDLAGCHVLPYFDKLGVMLRDTDRKVLQAYLDEKFRSGRKDGKGGLSPSSLRLHKNILHQTLDCAVRDGILPRNPCADVTLPQKQRREPHFYTSEQVNAMLDAFKDEPLFPLVRMTVLYGLRRSEVLGLKWDSVDFERKLITVRHTVVKVTRKVEKDKTKNASSYRSFPLLPDVEAMLRQMQQAEQHNRKLFGRDYISSDYLFKWDNGTSLDPDFVTHKFEKLLKQHGLPQIRFHDLRHSCASALISMGYTLKDIQEWLGHADIKMTANIYGHLDVQRKQNIAGALDGAFHPC